MSAIPAVYMHPRLSDRATRELLLVGKEGSKLRGAGIKTEAAEASGKLLQPD